MAKEAAGAFELFDEKEAQVRRLAEAKALFSFLPNEALTLFPVMRLALSRLLSSSHGKVGSPFRVKKV